MKTDTLLLKKPTFKLKVVKNWVNNYKVLLPNILYNALIDYSKSLIFEKSLVDLNSLKIVQLKLLKKAYLNEILYFDVEEPISGNNEINFTVLVKNNANNTIICKAQFSVKFSNPMASAS